MFCACNCRFYGGGFNPSVSARPDDGIMDIYIVKNVNLLNFAFLIGKYAAGRADELKKYITHLRTDIVEIIFDDENVINVDGEALYSKDVKLRVIPRALRLIVPKGLHFFDECVCSQAASV